MPKLKQNRIPVVNGTRIAQSAPTIKAPLAETFLPPYDMYISSVNLYFIHEDSAEKNSVTLYIANTIDNGSRPGNIYYGRVTLSPQQIRQHIPSNLGGINGTPTKFTFSNPVYVQAGKHYALVVKTDSKSYQIAVAIGGQSTAHMDQQDNQIVPTSGGYADGSMLVSTDGYSWSAVDPYEDIKFDINRAQFAPMSGPLEFNDVNLNQPYQTVYFDKKFPVPMMSNLSYLTFRPVQWTPRETEIDWEYRFINEQGQNTPFKPLRPFTSIPITGDGNVDGVEVRATLYSDMLGHLTPIIKQGSLELVAQLSQSNGYNNDMSYGINGTPWQKDKNAGEYVSRNWQQTDPVNPHHSDQFNMVDVNFEVQKSTINAPCPVSVFFNLNGDDEPNNPYPDKWHRIQGFDEYQDISNGPGRPSSIKYYTVDPDADNASATPFGHAYRQEIQNGNDLGRRGNWTLYHLRALLWNPNNYNLLTDLGLKYIQQNNLTGKTPKDLYVHDHKITTQATYIQGGQQFANQKLLDSSNMGGLAYGSEIQYKIIFDNADPHIHPKVRNFTTSLNLSDMQNDTADSGQN